jgi:hypothetical protein
MKNEVLLCACAPRPSHWHTERCSANRLCASSG